MRRWHSLAGLVIAMSCGSRSDAAGADQYTVLAPLDTVRVRITSRTDTVAVIAELAEKTDQQTMGLMERPSLAPNAGMLFLYPAVQSESSAFWMFRTRIPLDIAFIDSAGVIRTIQTMVPCTSTLAKGCPGYPAGARYRAALEVNAGFFGGRGIRVGDRVLLQDTLQWARRP